MEIAATLAWEGSSCPGERSPANTGAGLRGILFHSFLFFPPTQTSYFLCVRQTCSISLWHKVNKKERCMTRERHSPSPFCVKPVREVMAAPGRWGAAGPAQLPQSHRPLRAEPGAFRERLLPHRVSALPVSQRKAWSVDYYVVGVVDKSGQITTEVNFFCFPMRYLNVLDGHLRRLGR